MFDFDNKSATFPPLKNVNYLILQQQDKSEANELGKETVLDIESLNGDEFDVNSPAKHVMISYQWGVQTQMIRLKQHLKKAGFNVWMDVDNMGKKDSWFNLLVLR